MSKSGGCWVVARTDANPIEVGSHKSILEWTQPEEVPNMHCSPVGRLILVHCKCVRILCIEVIPFSAGPQSYTESSVMHTAIVPPIANQD